MTARHRIARCRVRTSTDRRRPQRRLGLAEGGPEAVQPPGRRPVRPGEPRRLWTDQA